MSLNFALREAGDSIAGLADRIHKLLDGHAVSIEKDRGLAAGEINLDFMHAGVLSERLLNRSFAFMAMHAFDFNDDELIPTDIRWHWWNSHNHSLVVNLGVNTP
jgi:hypothetical protein